MSSSALDAILRCRHWIFDMDGTLTVPAHDFQWLRRQLQIPAEADILGFINGLPEDEAARAHDFVNRWELEIAQSARPQSDAVGLLTTLTAAGCKLGVLTRNTLEGARITLRAAGLDSFFAPEDVLGREQAEPKPKPDGVQALLRGWSAAPSDAVVVGDWVHDVDAGLAAGTWAILILRHPNQAELPQAHLNLRRLDDLLNSLTP